MRPGWNHRSVTIHWHTIHWHHDSLTPRFTDTTIHWHHDSLTIQKVYILLIRMKISLRKTKNIRATPTLNFNFEFFFQFFLIWIKIKIRLTVWFRIMLKIYVKVEIKSENFKIIFVWVLKHTLGLFCSNMDLSYHAYILHTGVFEGEEFNEKSFICRKLTVLEIFEIFNEFP